MHIYAYDHIVSGKQRTQLTGIIFLPIPNNKIAKLYTYQCYRSNFFSSLPKAVSLLLEYKKSKLLLLKFSCGAAG